jgi:hypothetical protein
MPCSEAAKRPCCKASGLPDPPCRPPVSARGFRCPDKSGPRQPDPVSGFGPAKTCLSQDISFGCRHAASMSLGCRHAAHCSPVSAVGPCRGVTGARGHVIRCHPCNDRSRARGHVIHPCNDCLCTSHAMASHTATTASTPPEGSNGRDRAGPGRWMARGGAWQGAVGWAGFPHSHAMVGHTGLGWLPA